MPWRDSLLCLVLFIIVSSSIPALFPLLISAAVIGVPSSPSPEFVPNAPGTTNTRIVFGQPTATQAPAFAAMLVSASSIISDAHSPLSPSASNFAALEASDPNVLTPSTSWSYTPTSLVLSASAANADTPVSTAAGSFNLLIGDDVPVEGFITISTLLTSVTFTKAAIAAGQDCTLYARSTGQLQIRTVRAYSAGAQELLVCAVTGITVPFDNAAGRASASDPYVLTAAAVQVLLPGSDAGIAASEQITLRPADTPQYWFNFVPVDRVVTRGALESARLLRVSLDVYVYSVTPADTAIQQSVKVKPTCAGLTVETPSRLLSVASPYRVTKADAPLTVLFDVTNAAYYPFPIAECLIVISTMGSMARACGATAALTPFTRQFDFAFYPVAAALADTAEATHEAVQGNALIDVDFELVLYFHSAQTADWSFSVTLLAPLATQVDFTASSVTVYLTETAGLASLTCTPTVTNTTTLAFSSCGTVDALASNMFAPLAIRFGDLHMTYAAYQELLSTNSSAVAVMRYGDSLVDVPQQNTDITHEFIGEASSPPSVVPMLWTKDVVSANVVDPESSTPTVTAVTHQTYLFKVFFFKSVATCTIEYTYKKSTAHVGIPTANDGPCLSLAAGNVTCEATGAARMSISFRSTFAVAYETTSFSKADFAFTMTYTYVRGGNNSATINAFNADTLDLAYITTSPFALHVLLTDRDWMNSDLTATLQLYIFPLTNVVDTSTVTVRSDCGVYQGTGKAVTYQNLAGVCAPSPITSVSVNASCLPQAQPKYLSYLIATAFFFEDAEHSPFYGNETLPSQCFGLVTATPMTVYPLYDVPLGHIPYINMAYTATAFDITPAADPFQVITTVSGTFTIASAGFLTSTSIMSLVSATDSLIFTEAMLSGDCALSGIPTATQILFTPTKTITQGVSTVLKCTVTGMTVAYNNVESRVTESDPYVLLRTVVALHLLSSDVTTLTDEMVLRLSTTPTFYYHWISSNRVLEQGATTAAARYLKLSLTLFVYRSAPADAVIFSFYTAPVTESCPDLTISNGESALHLAAGQRLGVFTSASVNFGVTDARYYPFDDAMCLSLTSTTDTVAKAGTSTVTLDKAITRDLDFVWYPVTASLDVAVSPTETEHATAPVNVMWEVIIFAHKELAANWSINFTSQAISHPALVFSPNVTAQPSTTPYAKLPCTVTADNATDLRFSDCGAVISVGNFRFAPQVIRFGPVRTTYADYNSLFRTSTTEAGVAGMTAYSAIIPQQNTDIDDDIIQNSPAAVVVSHQLTKVVSASVKNATEPPVVLAMTDQTYLAKIFFFRKVSSFTVSYIYALSTQFVGAPVLSDTCASKVAGKMIDCAVSALRFTLLSAKFRVPYELSSFANTDFTFILDVTYASGELVS